MAAMTNTNPDPVNIRSMKAASRAASGTSRLRAQLLQHHRADTCMTKNCPNVNSTPPMTPAINR